MNKNLIKKKYKEKLKLLNYHNKKYYDENNSQISDAKFDELKKELLSLANIQDSGGSFIYAGFKSQTQPFVTNSSGLIEYKGDRGVLNLNLSETRLVESTIDGATVFQDIVTSAGVSTDLFAAIYQPSPAKIAILNSV